MDWEEIRALYKREGSKEPLKPIPPSTYSEIDEYIDKERRKAASAREMSEEMYSDMMGNVRRAKGWYDLFKMERLCKVGRMAMLSAICNNDVDTTNLTPEERNVYDAMVGEFSSMNGVITADKVIEDMDDYIYRQRKG